MKSNEFNKILSDIFNKKTDLSIKKELVDLLVKEDPSLINRNSGQEKFHYANIIYNSILREPELFKYIKEKNYIIDYGVVTNSNNKTLFDAIVCNNKEFFTPFYIDSILKSLNKKNIIINSDLFFKDEFFDIIKIIESPFFDKKILGIDYSYTYNYFINKIFSIGHPNIKLICEKIGIDKSNFDQYIEHILLDLNINKYPKEILELINYHKIDVQDHYNKLNKFNYLKKLSIENANILKNMNVNLYLDISDEQKIFECSALPGQIEEFINLYLNNYYFIENNNNYLDIQAQDFFFSKIDQENMLFNNYQKFNYSVKKINQYFEHCQPFSIKRIYHKNEHKHIFSFLQDIFIEASSKFPKEKEAISFLAKETVLNYIKSKGKNIFTKKEIELIHKDAELRYSLTNSSNKYFDLKGIDNLQNLLIENNYIVYFDELYNNNSNNFIEKNQEILKKYFKENQELKLSLFINTYLNNQYIETDKNFDSFYKSLDNFLESLSNLLEKDISKEISVAFNFFTEGFGNNIDKEKVSIQYFIHKNKNDFDNKIKKRL